MTMISSETEPASPSWICGLAFALGLLLLTIASGRVLGAFAALPANAVLRAAEKGAQLSTPALVEAFRSYEHALTFNPDGHLMNEASRLADFIARRPDNPVETQNDWQERVLEMAEEAVAATPAFTFSWAQLAYANLRLNGPSEFTAHIVATSVLVGFYDQPLLGVVRLPYIFAVWPFFDDRERVLATEQLRWFWLRDPNMMANLVRDSVSNRRILAGVLRDNPRAYADLIIRLGFAP